MLERKNLLEVQEDPHLEKEAGKGHQAKWEEQGEREEMNMKGKEQTGVEDVGMEGKKEEEQDLPKRWKWIEKQNP